MLLMIGFIFYTLLDTAILLFYLDFINLVVYLPPDQMDLLMILLETVLTTTMLFFCLSLILLGFQLLVFSNEEIRNASTLREQIKSISVERRIRGLLKE
jgi:magnesium-transporting ATPase (P-type)